MSEFGNFVKGVMNDLEKRESLEKKERKEKIVTYRCESSGIDMAVTRILNGKDTRTLVILLSQMDDNGKPVILMKEKDKVLEVTENSLRSFLDGADPQIITGCTAIPYLKKGKEFVETFWEVIHSKNFIKLAKMGVIDLECIVELNSRNDGPWYLGGYDRYSSIMPRINKMTEEMFENVHPKIIKYAVNYMMETFELPYHKALQYVYRNNGNGGYYRSTIEVDNGKKYIMNDSVTAFVAIANRYDEPFALQCMEEYMNDLNLIGLKGESVDTMLRIKTDGVFTKDNWGTKRGEYAGASLIYNGRSQVVERLAVNFEKRRFWEYILNATCVGRGRDLNGYVVLWRDYIEMAMTTDKKIKEKYPEYLQVEHDKYSEKYDFVKNTVEEQALMKVTEKASKICDVNIKDYQFRILRTPQAFCDEAAQNSNCVASYISKCSAGVTYVGSFRPKDSETTLLTVEIDPNTYRMIQIRGKFNRMATDKEMEQLNKIAKKIENRWKKFLETGNIEEDKEEKQEMPTLDIFVKEA